MSPEELVEANIGLARAAARSKCLRGIEDPDDVYSDCLLGLWDAARRFDDSRGAFATFAWPRMIGAIGDGRRERDHLSRSLRARGDVPAPVSLESAVHADDRGGAILTLADTLADPRDDYADVDEREVRWAAHVRLFTTIAALPPTDRYVVRRLLDGITLEEIGAELGFTESRACQISGRAIRRLRAVLYDPEAA